MHFNFDQYYNELNNNNILLAYNGVITVDWINGVLEAIEAKMDSLQIEPKVRKKVYNILVEGLQNLYHHTDDIKNIDDRFAHKFGVVVVNDSIDVIRISLGNFVPIKKVPYIKDKIDKINSLSEEELKDMYKFILNHQKLTQKGGGGLGLLDMARKSGNKLKYTFFEFNDEYQFFHLDLLINKN